MRERAALCGSFAFMPEFAYDRRRAAITLRESKETSAMTRVDYQPTFDERSLQRSKAGGYLAYPSPEHREAGACFLGVILKRRGAWHAFPVTTEGTRVRKRPIDRPFLSREHAFEGLVRHAHTTAFGRNVMRRASAGLEKDLENL